MTAIDYRPDLEGHGAGRDMCETRSRAYRDDKQRPVFESCRQVDGDTLDGRIFLQATRTFLLEARMSVTRTINSIYYARRVEKIRKKAEMRPRSWSGDDTPPRKPPLPRTPACHEADRERDAYGTPIYSPILLRRT